VLTGADLQVLMRDIWSSGRRPAVERHTAGAPGPSWGRKTDDSSTEGP
jgi:hypothetical protein